MTAHIPDARSGFDCIGVGVGIVVVHPQATPSGQFRLLAALRGPGARNDHHLWDLPGGGVEYSHTLEATVRRELLEEHGITAGPLEQLGTQDHFVYGPDDQLSQHWVTTTFIGFHLEGEPRVLEPHKCLEVGWFTLDELAQLPLTSTTAHNLQLLRTRRSGWAR